MKWLAAIFFITDGVRRSRKGHEAQKLSRACTLPGTLRWVQIRTPHSGRVPSPFTPRSTVTAIPSLDYRTEVRSRWTSANLYLLFICPYQELHLKPSPDTVRETNELWNWDVAELFIGSDFRDIRRYKEFEISPQGEWIDLDINLALPHHETGWTWNSGFEAAARIDRQARVWYGAMRIPFKSIDERTPAAGNRFRANLYRSQGPPLHKQDIAWKAPMTETFHTPERFGQLELIKEK